MHRLLSREGLLDKHPGDPVATDRRRFAFRDAGELWMSDVMHGPKVADGRRRRKTFLLAFIDHADTRIMPRRRNVPIELVTVPREGRAACRDWLRRRLEHPCDEVSRGGLANPAKHGLDSLFANLMVMIDQSLVHAVVHWHRGESDLADSAWEMSGAAMMHATSVVNTLAPHHVAPDPVRAVMHGDVALPRVAEALPDAMENQAVMQRVAALSGRCRGYPETQFGNGLHFR